jgi:sugar lactone lactonase YvrE
MGRPAFRFPGCAGILLALCCHAGAADVLGVRPAHLGAELPAVPNGDAMLTRIWAPEIDAGYVPQGVTIANGEVLVSSYRSTDPKVGTGPCRVYRIDPASGRTVGQFDMPPGCGHAGGMAYLGQGMLLVSDTRRLYKIDMARAFAGDGDAVVATLNLAGEMKGSLVDFDGKSIFIASSEKDAAKARAFFLPLSLFDSHNGATLEPSQASLSFAVPVDAQGAAFDRDGSLWMSFSNSKFGRLQKLDAASGTVLSSHDMVIGIEDIAFDGEGRLWSVSEAGSLRWSRWQVSYPVVFSIDPQRLR